jgi:hypothetical protein
MLRNLYRCILGLHPPAFRRRFGDEMLSIFDQSQRRLEAVRLFVDALASLLRQWIVRPEFWSEGSVQAPPQPALDGVPSFSTIDPFRPRTSAVMQGLLLTTAVFCLTCFAIRYSWIRVLHVRIPEVEFERPRWTPPSASSSDFQGQERSAATDRSAAKMPSASPPAARNAQARPQTSPDRNPKIATNRPAAPAAAVNAKAAAGTAFSRRAVPVATVPEAVLRSYVGLYVVNTKPSLAIMITLEDGELMMEAAGIRHALTPLSETQFVVSGTENELLEFRPDSNGVTNQLELIQSGQRFPAQRQVFHSNDRI